MDNLLLRIFNVVIELVTVVLGNKRSLSHPQQKLLTAETSDATNAAQSSGSNVVNVCQEILIQHPYTMTPECETALEAYVEVHHHVIAQQIMDSANTVGGDSEFRSATEKMDEKNAQFKTALSQLQAIINHEMLLALGKLLPLARHGGLVLPKLERAYSLWNQEERTKDPSVRRPYSAQAAIELINLECTGTSLATQGIARIALLRNLRPA